MTDDPQEWARDQLAHSDVPSHVRSAVLQLLANWFNNYLDSDQDKVVAAEAFYKLALNQALAREDDKEMTWSQAKPGNIYVRDQVRVAADAYAGDAGRLHNGRRGRVVAIRNGDIVVKYTDERQPTFEAVHHSPFKLERGTQ